jgi:PiT family inorganic phosphate transporter
MKVSYSRKNKGYFEDNRKFVNKLFNVPLIVAAALLSFAHGSNDVANAIGPFTAVYEAINNIDHAVVPFWILLF